MNPFGPVTVVRGDAAALPIPDGSVDLVVTSPPYFGLRSYTDGGKHYAGQVGDEATPAEYLDALAACTAEWVRVLKPGGSIFVNLGDKYATTAPVGSGGKGATSLIHGKGSNLHANLQANGRRVDNGATQPKSLHGLPWRYALRCIDDLGLILRAEIVWAKPNGLPESVTDRVRRSHEQVFHFVKQPRYFSAVDEVREPHLQPDRVRADVFGGQTATNGVRHGGASVYTGPTNPLGKLPGSVWTIPTAPLTVPDHLGVDHFAAYPPELVRRIVLGWSPREVCGACGEGRRPVVDREPSDWAAGKAAGEPLRHGLNGAAASGAGGFQGLRGVLSGYACACPDTTAPTTPGIVLDPFGGTGTTALVASAYGRTGISVDLSADYCRLAAWRTADPGERARALEVDKPAPQVDGQLGLFDGLGA